jgi:hypothetical protein
MSVLFPDGAGFMFFLSTNIRILLPSGISIGSIRKYCTFVQLSSGFSIFCIKNIYVYRMYLFLKKDCMLL